MRKLFYLCLPFLWVSACSAADHDLFEAIKRGDHMQVQRHINQAIDPNQRDELGRPLLILAVMNNRLEIVRMLLRSGADPNTSYENIPALMFAATSNRCSQDIVDALLAARADPNGEASLTRSTPLLEAAAYGNYKCVDSLLKAGANVDAVNEMNAGAAYHAALGGNVLIMQRLIKAGATLDKQSKQGATPLMMAVAGGHREIVELLLEHRVNACAKDVRGKSARIIAADRGRPDLLSILPEC